MTGTIIRPRSVASPKWALNAVAENLFRGRDPKNAPAGRHHLLPRVIHDNISKKRNIEDLLLLEGSLSVFLAALKDILPYAYISLPYSNKHGITTDAENIKYLSLKIITWLKSNPRKILLEGRPPELRQLYDSLSLDGIFVKGFNAIFQVDINYIKNYLEKAKSENLSESNKLDFVFVADKNTLNSTILCYINSLLNILVNHTIDPIVQKITKHKSKLLVYKESSQDEFTEQMIFRLLTNFDTLEETNRKIFETKRGLRELKNIEIFGAKLKNRKWFIPNNDEIKEGYTAAWEIIIPTGYLSKENNNVD